MVDVVTIKLCAPVEVTDKLVELANTAAESVEMVFDVTEELVAQCAQTALKAKGVIVSLVIIKKNKSLMNQYKVKLTELKQQMASYIQETTEMIKQIPESISSLVSDIQTNIANAIIAMGMATTPYGPIATISAKNSVSSIRATIQTAQNVLNAFQTTLRTLIARVSAILSIAGVLGIGLPMIFIQSLKNIDDIQKQINDARATIPSTDSIPDTDDNTNEKEWQQDEEYHWKISNEDDGHIVSKSKHTYDENGECISCGHKKKG